jgi:hypothetical protein
VCCTTRPTRAALLAHLRELSAVERLAFAGDQWALVRADKAPVESWLDIVDALGNETDYDVLDGIVGPLGSSTSRWPATGRRSRPRCANGRRALPRGVHAARVAADGSEDDDTRLRRAALLRIVGLVAESPAVMHEASQQLERYLVNAPRSSRTWPTPSCTWARASAARAATGAIARSSRTRARRRSAAASCSRSRASGTTRRSPTRSPRRSRPTSPRRTSRSS